MASIYAHGGDILFGMFAVSLFAGGVMAWHGIPGAGWVLLAPAVLLAVAVLLILFGAIAGLFARLFI